jgi:hypothetical protein
LSGKCEIWRAVIQLRASSTLTSALFAAFILLLFITYTGAVFNHTIGCIAQQEIQTKCPDDPDAAGIMA